MSQEGRVCIKRGGVCGPLCVGMTVNSVMVTSRVHHGRIWTDMDGYGRIWTDMDGCGRFMDGLRSRVGSIMVTS